VADVLREWRFWRVALGFGVCGFHVAFLAAHMPGVIERCGLLCGLYAARALSVASLLALPATPWVMLGFAVVMGATHMATLPPTTQLVSRQHGVQRLGTLIGFVMLVHQVGSFAGIWLGGWAAEATGSDRLMWCVDAALALCAAALVWPLRAGNGGWAPAGRISPALPHPSSMSLPTLSRARK
jgi:predicted MFS family arabinose efflux permease